MKTAEVKNANIKVARSIVNLALAKEITAAAEAKAKEIKVPMYIVIDDADANLISIHRMAGVILVSERIALDKAYTAVALKTATVNLVPLVQPGAALYGLQNSPNMVVFGGGSPLVLNGEMIGSIGVSGGSVDEDMIVANAGLARFKEIAEGLKHDGDAIPAAPLKHLGADAVTDYGISVELAEHMAVAVEKKANELKVPMWFAALDRGANLILQERMDDSILVSREVSINKAYTAVALKARTDAIVGVCQPGTVLYGLQNCSRMIIFGGGYPLVHKGKTIGGIGVSGGSVAEDMQCAEAALEIYKAHASA
jgi:uncharacterized protein GlcG (DUF336 family)